MSCGHFLHISCDCTTKYIRVQEEDQTLRNNTCKMYLFVKNGLNSIGVVVEGDGSVLSNVVVLVARSVIQTSWTGSPAIHESCNMSVDCQIGVDVHCFWKSRI